jgi:hypothetical protein
MHSSLSLAVGYNRIVTHGGRRCNDVVAILAKDEAPSLCSTCRTPASILSSAALSGTPPRRGPSLCALCALRGTSGGETMTTPVGRVHLRETGTTPTVRGAPASIIGSELSVYLAPALRFAPPRCPKPSTRALPFPTSGSPNLCPRTPTKLTFLVVEFSEVRGSKLPNSGRALWRRGGAVRGCCCLLATRSPRKQRGIVASGHRLLRSRRVEF